MPDLDLHPVGYWPSVADLWQHEEGLHRSTEDWLDLWRAEHPDRGSCMSPEDRAVYDQLPEVVKVWRGVSCADDDDPEAFILNGLSWTLSREKAEWFARRWSRFGILQDRETPTGEIRNVRVTRAILAATEVHKSVVLAYFNGRDEAECVLDPVFIEEIEIIEIPVEAPEA
ncbi:hypothetical protein [Propylenella binzhouense]|uniref:Uncharacterized protein n=1 Tax=Propylenella binzhouense TaxID=2555902 RepID=A0A964T140_9HYPH|nr:hypothetical protein [Propylenella binzhouense]MYZ46453.1 hypothetical protein [Propylenella binzhouense]